MDLSKVFSSVSQRIGGARATAPENFLAVKISPDSVAATVWSVREGKVMVGQVNTAPVSSSADKALLEACDQAVSAALVRETPAIVKTIFAVPLDWVAGGKLLPDRLGQLKNISKQLDLIPQGYVVLNEALENYFKEAEGAPLTAILVGIEGERGILTMYRAGQNLGSAPFEIASLENIPEAIEKTLKRFANVDVLPSRIILYDSKTNLEEISQKLTAFPWTKQLPFLHFPKVEIIPAELVVKAVAIASGMQLGASFEPEEGTEATGRTGPVEELAGEKSPGPTQEKVPEMVSEVEEISAQEAGFATTSEGATVEVRANPFGQMREIGVSQRDDTAFPRPTRTPPEILTKFRHYVGLVPQKLALLPTFLPRGAGNFRFFPLGVLLAIALIFLVIAFYFLPKATIIVKVSPKSFDHQMSVVVTTDSTKLATTSAVLLGSFAEVEEMGTKKGIATGKKLVGDKAKGSVTITSSVTSSKTLPAGTIISSPDGLKFTLDNSVDIASAGGTAALSSATSPVTAVDIGDRYNLSTGTLFTVADFPASSYQAKNDAAFSGGNSHQATVVTKTDQDRLAATLSAELTAKAQTHIQAKIDKKSTLLPNAMTATAVKKKFSKDVDAEADTLSLDLTLDFRGVVFSEKELLTLFTQNFGSDIPSGFTPRPDNLHIEIQSAKTDKAGNAVLDIRLQASLLPDIDTTKIIKNISGKSFSFAQSYLSKLPSSPSAELEVKPRVLTGIVRAILPLKKDNIKVQIVSQ